MSTDAPTRPPGWAPPPGPGEGRPPMRTRSRRRTVAIAAAAVAAVVLLLLIVLSMSDPVTDDPKNTILVGKPAPELVGTPVIGDRVEVGDGRTWVVVNFFGSWCTPCLVEHPELKAFDREHADDDVKLVSVMFNDTPAGARRFFREHGGDWPVINDADGTVAVDYGIISAPETFVVSPQGIVVGKFSGPTTKAALDRVIQEAGG